MIKKYFIFIILMTPSLYSLAQAPSFSQFFQKSPYINPAYAGILGGEELHTIIHHREQWMNVPIRFSTSMISNDWRVCQKNLGIGIIILQNIEGEGLFKTTEVSFPLASHISISKNISLSAALQLTGSQKTLDWDNLIFSDELHPVLGNIYSSSAVKPNLNYSRVYLSSGLIGTYKFTTQNRKYDHISFGASVHNITGNYDSFYGTQTESLNPSRLTLHANYLFKNDIYGNILNKNISFFDYVNIYGIYEAQGFFGNSSTLFNTKSLGLGLSMQKIFMFGLTYRHAVRKTEDFDSDLNFRKSMSESIIYNFIFNLNPKNTPYRIYISYSYDMNISDFTNRFSGPTHELSLNMYFGKIRCKPRKRKNRGHLWSHIFDMGRRGDVYNREMCQPFSKINEWDGY